MFYETKTQRIVIKLHTILKRQQKATKKWQQKRTNFEEDCGYFPALRPTLCLVQGGVDEMTSRDAGIGHTATPTDHPEKHIWQPWLWLLQVFLQPNDTIRSS